MMLETYRLTNPCDKVWDIKEVEIRVMKNFGENVKYVLDIEWKEEDKNSMFGPFKPSVQWKLEFKSLFAIKNYYTKIFQPSNWCDKPKWIINN